MQCPPDPLSLIDWKRHIAAIYEAARAGDGAPEALAAFRAAKDRLFGEHAESPVPQESRASFAGIDCFPYDSNLRLSAPLEAAPETVLEIASSTGAPVRFTRIGVVRPRVADRPVTLSVYWLDAYGGGDLPALPRRHGGQRDLRRWALSPRHGQGGRPRPERRWRPHPRLQLRLQPLVRLRPTLELPLGTPGEPCRRADRRR